MRFPVRRPSPGKQEANAQCAHRSRAAVGKPPLQLNSTSATVASSGRKFTLWGGMVVLWGGITVLRGRIVVLWGGIFVLRGGIFALCGVITALRGGIVALCGRIVALCGGIVVLRGRIVALCGEITVLRGGLVVSWGERFVLSGACVVGVSAIGGMAAANQGRLEDRVGCRVGIAMPATGRLASSPAWTSVPVIGVPPLLISGEVTRLLCASWADLIVRHG